MPHLWRFLLYFTLTCAANYFYPGSHYFVQGVLLIVLWGNWLPVNSGWHFAQKYGRYFNWFGVLFILNACYHIFGKQP